MSNATFRKHCPTLSGRLMLLFITMAIIIVITIASVLGWAFRNHFQETMRPHLIQYLDYQKNDIGDPPQRDKAEVLAKQLNIDIHFISKKEQWATRGEPFDIDDFHYFRQFEIDGVEYGFGHHDNHEYLISRYPNYTLAFAIQRQDGGWHTLIIVIIVLIVLVLLYQATRRLFAPIEQLKYGIEQIGSGQLDYRIDIRRRDELGELGNSINAMAADIQRMLEAKRQLLLAISHELRSPLTRAKISAELIDDGQRRNEIHQELNEMDTLITELLEIERLSTNHQALHKSKCILQTLINTLLADHFGKQKLIVNLPTAAIHAEVDITRIKLLLKNLIDNALRHNTHNAPPPQLSVEEKDQQLLITIQDFGQGIEAQHIPHLTEPFYRVDAARQRQTGGYGLGLYLCKVIAEAHQGQLKITSQPGKGTRVSLSFPR